MTNEDPELVHAVRVSRSLAFEVSAQQGAAIMKPDWLLRAESFIGLREIPGPASSPIITRWMARIKASWLGGDDVPWCGTALANWMLDAGVTPPNNPFRALSWRAWGVSLDRPIVGCVGVMERVGGGHVTLIVGEDGRGYLLGLGGNQSDGVRVSSFPRAGFVAFRWPPLRQFSYAALPTGYAPTETRVV